MYVAFDTETGGLTDKSSLLSIYLQILDNDLNYVDEINLLVKPDSGEYRIYARAMEVNQIDLLEHDKKAIKETEAREAIRKFFSKHFSKGGRYTPLGHNVNFDINRLKKLIGEEMYSRYLDYRILDTLGLAQLLQFAGILKRGSCRLGVIAEQFSIEPDEGEDLHDAKVDTVICIKVLKKFVELLKTNTASSSRPVS